MDIRRLECALQPAGRTLFDPTNKSHAMSTMQPSMFNLRVPLEARGEVFLMNTLTDAQLIVSSDVGALLDRCEDEQLDASRLDDEERAAIELLSEHGFLVAGREVETLALDRYFETVKNDASELNITVLTTLQCNFACGYCFQGDHGDYNKFAEKMTLETSAAVVRWIERELDRVHPERLVLTFFGGEPLLNLPVMYDLAERLWAASELRDVRLAVNIITNGLLLTPAIVERLTPHGLNGIKITLDGDRDTHNRLRPLRGGQGTFDRIVQNIRACAGLVPISIGGNFDEASADSYPALLDFLAQQEFADRLVKVNFKPIIGGRAAGPRNVLALTPVDASGKPLGGTCMTAAGVGASGCGTCGLAEEKMTFLREETTRRGFPTPNGIPGGPCHVHMTHAHTIGPDGSLYACPGFTGAKALSTGHIDDRHEPWRESARERFNRLHPWKECADCAFIPVCAGGCVMASYSELGDMNLPTCHKRAYESAVISLAHRVAGTA